MALCVTGVLSGAAYKGLTVAVRGLTGQTITAAKDLSGEPALKRVLYQYDVIARLETTNLFLETLDSLGCQYSPPVARILSSIRDTIADLGVALADARSKIEYYRNSIFYGWRGTDVSQEIDQIVLCMGVLSGQMDTLYKITGLLQTMSHTQPM